MTDITRLNEYNLSEKPAIDLLERMGYSYTPDANLQQECTSLRDAIILVQLEVAIRHINPAIDEQTNTK